MSKLHTQLTMVMGIGVIVMMTLWSMTLPLSAQDSAFATNTPVRGFATNTPESSPVKLITPIQIATNTPEPQTPQPGPVSGFSNYALRLWLEGDVLDVLLEQVALLNANNVDTLRAVELLQYELEFRFPGAPRNIEDRAELVTAMINAPIGTVDMQSVVRPYIENAINNGLVEDGQFEGFTIEVMTANLDAGNVDDAVVHIVYPDADTEAVRYEDYVLAIGDTDGELRFVPSNFNNPIVPYNVDSIFMERLADANADGVDELVLVVDDGDLNRLMYIIGYRGGEANDLTRTSDIMRFGDIAAWANGEPIVTHLYQLADEKWNCISQLTVTWNYFDNFYRPTVDTTSSFQSQSTFGCLISAAEPLFAMRPASATQMLTDALVRYGSDAERTDRAVITLAMLYALDGQVNLASETAIAAQTVDSNPESWVYQQAELMLEMIGEPDNTAFDICVALAEADHGEEGACDVEALLGRVFDEAVFPADIPIATQLEQIGLQVVRSTVIQAPGFADRIAIDFGIESAGWWAFVSNEGFYTGQPIDSPIQNEQPRVIPPMIAVPQAVYATLLTDEDIAGVLNIIDNTRVANPNIPFSEAFQYIEAMSNDLLNNREVARRTYYDVWEAYPESIWGELAGKHLELR